MIEINYSDGLRLRKFKLNKKVLVSISQNFSKYLEKEFPLQVRYLTQSNDNFSLSILFVGKKRMQKLNYEQRNKNYATDVLSFPMLDQFQKFSLFKTEISFDPSNFLGDIVVCSDVCLKQAREHKVSYQREAIHLIGHGFLHLLGFDHEISVAEERKMQKEEDKLIKLFDHIS